VATSSKLHCLCLIFRSYDRATSVLLPRAPNVLITLSGASLCYSAKHDRRTQPSATTPAPVLPPNFRDVTAERVGTIMVIVGATAAVKNTKPGRPRNCVGMIFLGSRSVTESEAHLDDDRRWRHELERQDQQRAGGILVRRQLDQLVSAGYEGTLDYTWLRSGRQCSGAIPPSKLS
jgi:hypothetical protein